MTRSGTTVLPARYQRRWRDTFEGRIAQVLRPGIIILDVGSGSRPALHPDQRPVGCHYVGLDISAAELQRAPTGSYDEVWVSDVTERVAELQGRFDLIVSWQVLEHVKPLDTALENLQAYLRPGGQLVAQLSGAYSIFGLINRMVPRRLGCWAMRCLNKRPPNSVFPAYYDRCWYGALSTMLSRWQSFEVVPLYRGAVYLGFSPLLQRLYLLYEDRVIRNDRRNLASHYVIVTIR